MKKLLSLVLVIAFGFASSLAMACPKGEVLTGGTGPHHKGGSCTPKVVKDKKAPMAKEVAPAKK